jgi:hypothetical protein
MISVVRQLAAGTHAFLSNSHRNGSARRRHHALELTADARFRASIFGDKNANTTNKIALNALCLLWVLLHRWQGPHSELSLRGHPSTICRKPHRPVHGIRATPLLVFYFKSAGGGPGSGTATVIRANAPPHGECRQCVAAELRDGCCLVHDQR